MNYLTSSLAALAVSATASFAGTVTTVQSFGGPVVTGSIDVIETLNGSNGRYAVANNTNGELLGFGVSNSSFGSFPVVINDDGFPGDFACDNDDQDLGFFCYGTRRLTASNWSSEIAYEDFGDQGFVEYTFQEIYGDFSSVTSDAVINWYDSVDGGLQAGRSATNFFGFQSLVVASEILAIVGDFGAATAVTAGSATGPTAPVPVPASALLLAGGLGGMVALRRRRQF